MTFQQLVALVASNIVVLPKCIWKTSKEKDPKQNNHNNPHPRLCPATNALTLLCQLSHQWATTQTWSEPQMGKLDDCLIIQAVYSMDDYGCVVKRNNFSVVLFVFSSQKSSSNGSWLPLVYLTQHPTNSPSTPKILQSTFGQHEWNAKKKLTPR